MSRDPKVSPHPIIPSSVKTFMFTTLLVSVHLCDHAKGSDNLPSRYLSYIFSILMIYIII
ncbi:MAG: hypothetical protein VX783_02345 [Chloroflexota bacterium]|nr:hypothetical protein [Chloroflexota bacterium]